LNEAFAADPKLADDLEASHRFRGACSAALAGCGRGGEEAARLDEAARADLRRQAHAWLRADLTLCSRPLREGAPPLRAGLREMFHGWQADPSLAGVRDAGALAALPAAERAGWVKLWTDVAATRARARDGK